MNVIGRDPQKKKNIHLSRKKAEELLNGIIERAEQINASPDSEYMYWVTKIAVFGSYLTDKEKLGDLDIAVEVVGRWNPSDDHNKILEMRKIILRKDGKVFTERNLDNYPREKVSLTLKKRSKGISLHEYYDVKEHNFQHKIVYDCIEGMNKKVEKELEKGYSPDFYIHVQDVTLKFPSWKLNILIISCR